jgi:hypothetical protein
MTRHGLLAHYTAIADDLTYARVIITSAGSAFCAGADLKSGGVRAGDEHPFVTVMKTIWESPKPILGHQRPASAVARGLAAACDHGGERRRPVQFSEVRWRIPATFLSSSSSSASEHVALPHRRTLCCGTGSRARSHPSSRSLPH